ncbi:MAG: AarF/UbiB family protein [Trichodesmium sp. St16_bin4-tuft]|nr:AarF/UbiB family protein [Trichodesmium sp. ALOHA_ZT_67]MDE5068139.1 AarF/UbiB family protein [Trichodesmium sp. St4_bin8_1]MDE5071189.1 AarF/UbiB family protein [Trichodesmium sp. St5_bin8]MDE5092433.1 AarF/UbiB family protein [Trichodesmium sp. St18_bin3_1_1]MDE5095091.1 AarF/UbiB family protein [Trichodesmium sp. St11_bin5]MDE5098576.1 AarF/UbiB family protein [Trichodesmium sp. St16_bin4-tuft]MDE5102213.1 AarF/UbiB family protein [Trichodesmium sp. St19_bin2]MDT9339712.1 AarF/UbiB fam
MLNKKYIPTPLIEKKKKKKVKIVEKIDKRRVTTPYVIRRFIIYFLAVQWRRFTGKANMEKTATQLREIFEDFGGFWVKAGQVLALRTDILPEPICDALQSLQSEALGFPFDIVRSTIESELGVPLKKVFAVFDEEPLAAASIAQVHTAVLRKKQIPVVVKVQRPGLEDAFQRDLNVIKGLVNLLIFLNIATYLGWGEFIAELDKTFKEELDFRYEASSTIRMRKSLKEHKVFVPKIYEKYSKRRILVMEFINGVMMSDYITALASQRSLAAKWEEENNIDRVKLGERLYLSLFRQLFEDNLFHADLHPGNIILLRNNKFVLIDHGSTGSLEAELRNTYLNYVNGLGEGNFTKAADYYIRFGVGIPKVDIDRVRVEMGRQFENWYVRSQVKGVPFRQKSLGGAIKGVTDVAFGYKIPTNWDFLKLTRSVLALDGSLQYLWPDIDVFEVINKYNKQARRRALVNNLRPENILKWVNQASDIVNQYNYLVLPEVRKRTNAYELTVNQFALSMVVILRRSSYLVLVAEFGALYVFLYQHYFQIIRPINIQMIDEIVSKFPYIPYLEWVGILIVVGLIFQVLLVCAKILGRKELNI